MKNKNGSRSILSEFVPFIKKLQKKGAHIRQIKRKEFYRHEGRQLAFCTIDEKTLLLRMLGDGNMVQEIILLFENPDSLKLGLKLSLEKNEALLLATRNKSSCGANRLQPAH